MNEISIDNYISFVLIAVLLVQYLGIVIVGTKMIRNGYNGVIRAIVANRIAISILLIIVGVHSVIALPDELFMLSLASLIGTNLYMHAALSTEAKRPIRTQEEQ